MAVVKGIRRINPLDLDRNFTIGLEFPLNEENLFSGTETTADQARANLIDILLTYPGERINLPNFGVGLRNLLFEQNIDLVILKEKIETQVARYMGNIRIDKLDLNYSEDQQTIFISITYGLLDGTSDSIQLNFN